MFTIVQQVLLQAVAAAIAVFFLGQIGGLGLGPAILWGLIVGIVVFFLRRQNVKVEQGTDVLRTALRDGLEPRGLRAVGPATGARRADQVRPASLQAPVNGTPDDLSRINGIGPKLQQQLNELGYFHFDQIASWSPENIAWLDEELAGFKGRASRDNWVGQARELVNQPVHNTPQGV